MYFSDILQPQAAQLYRDQRQYWLPQRGRTSAYKPSSQNIYPNNKSKSIACLKIKLWKQ